MPKKYNLSKKSDIRRLERDLENQFKKMVQVLEVECPSCRRKLSVRRGTKKQCICGQVVGYS